MNSKHHFVICVNSRGYAASLEPRKLYEFIPDELAHKHNQIRIIDESGDDYLYPDHLFVSVDLSEQIEKAILVAA